MKNPHNGQAKQYSVKCFNCRGRVPVAKRDTYRDPKTGERRAMVARACCSNCMRQATKDAGGALKLPTASTQLQRADPDAAPAPVLPGVS